MNSEISAQIARRIVPNAEVNGDWFLLGFMIVMSALSIFLIAKSIKDAIAKRKDQYSSD